jgi:hypothetical protein
LNRRIYRFYRLVAGLILAYAYGLDAFQAWAAVALLGAMVIMFLGYGYVGLALLLRYSFGPRQSPA